MGRSSDGFFKRSRRVVNNGSIFGSSRCFGVGKSLTID